MAVSAVIAAVSTGVTAVSGGALLGGFLVAGGVATIGTHFLVTTAMGAALNSLSPKLSNATATASGYALDGTSGTVLDHQIIYGEVKVGGAKVFDDVTGVDNQYLHRILVFAGHKINSFQKIYVDDELVTLDVDGNVTAPARFVGYMRIKTHNGTPGQNADYFLMTESEKWTPSHKLSGLAYLYIRMKINTNVYPSGPPFISALIRGMEVYDPRTGLSTWSDNWALCMANYIEADFGLNQPRKRISQDMLVTAANVCSEVVGGQPRYTCNGMFLTDLTPAQILTDMTSAGAGILYYSQGKWRIVAGKYVNPTRTFTISNLRSGIKVTSRHSRRDNFNTVKGRFRSPETNWELDDYPAVTDPAYVAVDGGYPIERNLDLPFTDNAAEAQRIANIALRRNREQITLTALFDLSALKVTVGEVVRFTYDRYGWNLKNFEVINWAFALNEDLALVISMTLRETSSAVFTTVSGAVFEKNNTTLLDRFYVPPISINPSTSTETNNESSVLNIVLNVMSPDETNVSSVAVDYRISGSTNWISIGEGDVGRWVITNTGKGSYDFRAIAKNQFGIEGQYVTYSNYPYPGSAVSETKTTDQSGERSGNMFHLEWEPPSDMKISHSIIRHSVLETGAVFSNSAECVKRVTRSQSSVEVPAKPGTYMIKVVDKFGNHQESFDSVVLKSANLQNFVTNLSLTDSTTFTGTKTGCSVSGSKLSITDVTVAPATANYVFSTHIDTGAVRDVRARVDLDTERFSKVTINLDALPGNWDDMVGLWDGWDNCNEFYDTNVITYISETNDDPAAAPVWSPWRKFKSGDYRGRAFRFSLDLKTTTANVTPRIISLTARVMY